ncbi:MAG: hypothetical protein ACTHMS_11030 [Jatrophihabitans sp.]|uniref:hypothetical protein n=1 Tax=Jatrophihabitans sp. TaxID=1932789 RepID=UPI003F8220BB
MSFARRSLAAVVVLALLSALTVVIAGSADASARHRSAHSSGAKHHKAAHRKPVHRKHRAPRHTAPRPTSTTAAKAPATSAPTKHPVKAPAPTTSPAPSPTPAPTTSPTPTPAPTPSGVTWTSGVYPGDGIDAAAATRFGTWRGAPVGLATVYTDRSSWANFADDMWCVQQYQGFAGRISIGIPLTLGSTTLADVANGAADQYFTTYAHNLAALGRGTADLRIGWEFNGDWMPWSATDPTAFVAAFRHVARLFKTVLPQATIDWNGNWGGSQSGHDPFTELWPGDDVVDVVGLDAYDGGWVPARTAAEFATWAAADHGLDAWLAFAQQHGKKLALPEWGDLANEADGDNPAFIDGMVGFFRAHAADLAYEAYFNDTNSAFYTTGGATSLTRSAAEYRAQWSGAAA